ncbi:MAG: TIR domain-containing protein [Chloroflexota bacterium]|nr:TIR domain-containing protein [Chloroflexota bacterium]
MDTPLLIILILFIIVSAVLAFRYRRQIMEEVEDIFDGDDEDTQQTQTRGGETAAPPVAQEQPLEPAKPDLPLPVRPITPLPPKEPQSAAPWDVESEMDDAQEESPAPSRGIGELPEPVPSVPQPAPAIPAPGGTTTGAIIPADSTKFSAYYPRETSPQVWQPLAVYAFRQSAAPDVIKDVGTVLGSRLNDFRRTEDSARQTVNEGAMITATPLLPGFQINPPQITLGFYEPFHRFDFKVRATSAPLDLAANGMVTFTVEGIIIAELPISIFVGRMVGESLTGAVTKPAYTSIFCSYSRDDTTVVERVERAYKALGFTYLRDVISLRSGQDWNSEILKLIETADLFQLFWSPTAAESKYVREEWEHALKFNRPVRPVYWQKPIPKVPDELRSIHFAYLPELGEQ